MTASKPKSNTNSDFSRLRGAGRKSQGAAERVRRCGWGYDEKSFAQCIGQASARAIMHRPSLAQATAETPPKKTHSCIGHTVVQRLTPETQNPAMPVRRDWPRAIKLGKNGEHTRPRVSDETPPSHSVGIYLVVWNAFRRSQRESPMT